MTGGDGGLQTSVDRPGADPGGGRWGGRPPLGRRSTIQYTPFNSIQAPVHHWAPSPGRNPVSAPADGDMDIRLAVTGGEGGLQASGEGCRRAVTGRQCPRTASETDYES